MRTLKQSKAPHGSRFVPPLAVRKLQAEMKLKHLDLADLVAVTRIPYLTLSRLLNGRVNDPARLSVVRRAIERAATPEATV